MSAASERQRRSTAGHRMSNLVGKALDDDEAFWGHDTWDDDDQSGNESFRESDEDSEARVDQFDSDFDESESDNDEEEEAAGKDEELQLRREERTAKRKQKFDIAKAGRDLMRKKKGKGKKRIMGDGVNAGLVLNFPQNVGAPPPVARLPLPAVSAAQSNITLPADAAKVTSQASLVRKSGRLNHMSVGRNLRAATQSKTRQAETLRKSATTVSSSTSAPPKKKRRRFTQEELLLESATETEPENQRWLLGRKRVEELASDSQKMERGVRGKVIYRFHSRRGCPNTLTFSDMDHLPDILARQAVPKRPKAVKRSTCVISGRPARYLDPKTKMGYHDGDAFRELRRRHQAGESLDQRPHEEKGGEGGMNTVSVAEPMEVDVQKPDPQPGSSATVTTGTEPVLNGHGNPNLAGKQTYPMTSATTLPDSSGGESGLPKDKSDKGAPARPASVQPAKKAPVPVDPKEMTPMKKTAPSQTTPVRSPSMRRKKTTPKVLSTSHPSTANSQPAVANAVPSRNDLTFEPQSVSPETTRTMSTTQQKPLQILQQPSK